MEKIVLFSGVGFIFILLVFSTVSLSKEASAVSVGSVPSTSGVDQCPDYKAEFCSGAPRLPGTYLIYGPVPCRGGGTSTHCQAKHHVCFLQGSGTCHGWSTITVTQAQYNSALNSLKTQVKNRCKTSKSSTADLNKKCNEKYAALGIQYCVVKPRQKPKCSDAALSADGKSVCSSKTWICDPVREFEKLGKN